MNPKYTRQTCLKYTTRKEHAERKEKTSKCRKKPKKV